MKCPIALYGLVDQDSTLLSVETNHVSCVNKLVIDYSIRGKRDFNLFLAFPPNKGKSTFECLHTIYQHIIGAEERPNSMDIYMPQNFKRMSAQSLSTNE